MTSTKALALPAIAFAAAVALFLHAASLRLPIGALFATPMDASAMNMDQIILMFGLLPRAAVAMLAGAALGLSGALLQQLLRNPIADPSTLGISSGAQLTIVISTLFYPDILDGYRSLVALAGAAGAAAIVFALGWRRSFEPVTMVVSGLLVGITASAFSAALTLSQGEYLMSLVTWNGGSLAQQDWSVAATLAAELAVGAVLAFLLVRPLVVLGLGDAGAQSLGISLKWVRLAVAAIATALAASVAAGVGLVSFIGLAAPALVRACGMRRPAAILVGSPFAGAVLLWFCDGAVQFLASTTAESFPTGAVTALIGGPLLLWLLPKVRNGQVAADHTGDPHRIRSGSSLWLLLLGVPVIQVLAFAVGRGEAGWGWLDIQQMADLFQFRWPRLLASGAAGGLLAITGTILQRMTGNPMASPEVIGVSGGAGIGFAAAISIVPLAGNFELFVGAGIGALVALSLVIVFASRNNLSPERLLLAGIAVSSLSSSILAGLLAIGDQRSWQILAWLGGTASTATAESAAFLAVLGVMALGLSLTFSRWLTLLPLGELVPQSLGLPMRSSRIIMLLVCGLTTGAASLLVGPLSFVGLVAPHIAARAGFLRARDHLIASFLLGVLLMMVADFGARTATYPYELPLGLFAALAGAPYLIWLISRRA